MAYLLHRLQTPLLPLLQDIRHGMCDLDRSGCVVPVVAHCVYTTPHTYTPTHATHSSRTYRRKHRHPRTHTDTPRTDTHTHARTRTHTRTHTYARTHAHTHARTQTHVECV